MSGKLAMRVLESRLSPALKPTAVTMALFANDDGERCYPSVERVAHLLGVSRRTAERHLSKLRTLGILVPETSLNGGRMSGGRGRSVMYYFDAGALPERPPYKPRRRCHGLERANTDAPDGVRRANTPARATGTPAPVTQTPTPVSQNADASVGRSYRSDLLEGHVRVNSESGVADAPQDHALSLQEREKPEDLKNDEPAELGAPASFESFIGKLRAVNPGLASIWLQERERRQQIEPTERRLQRKGAHVAS